MNSCSDFDLRKTASSDSKWKMQTLVNEAFLLVLAEEKNIDGFWYYKSLYKPVKSKLEKHFGLENPKVSMSQISESIKQLREGGFIEVGAPHRKEGKSKHRGQPKKPVSLTLWGLLRALHIIFFPCPPTQERALAILDNLAKSDSENTKKLHLIFKNWKYFQDKGIEKEMVKRLQKFFEFINWSGGENYFSSSFRSFGEDKNLKKDFESYIVTILYDYVFLFLPMHDFFDSDSLKKWFNVVLDDKEISSYISERTKHFEMLAESETRDLVSKIINFKNQQKL